MTPAQLDFDRRHLWHPYTSLTDPLPVYPVASASGFTLTLADGRELIDGMSSWWCAIHGYNVPELNRAVRQQVERMAHVMFGGLTHQPAIELGRRLVAITPPGLDRVFLADSGSVSVEVAMKMAVQYQHGRGQRDRTTFLTFRGGYHGDTTGPMAVCDPDTGMHGLFAGFLQQHAFYDRPPAGVDRGLDPAYVDGLEAFFTHHADGAAAFIVEPVVQGAGGMHFYSPAYLPLLRKLCDRHHLLLIFDEIATGFGRTGSLFVSSPATAVPDILCVGKGLTGGYMTLAATLCSAEVADTIGRGPAGVMMHGPTYMGNPLACAVAVASIDLLLASDWHAAVSRIESALVLHLRPARALTGVKHVRVLGAIGVVEMTEPVDVAHFQAFCTDRGVWIRPFGRLIYVMPPYIIDEEGLGRLCRTVVSYVIALSA